MLYTIGAHKRYEIVRKMDKIANKCAWEDENIKPKGI